jgi:O-antigen/teichoic acid export membrane protein
MITNAVVLAVVRVAAPACSLLLVVMISRRLGAEGLGCYSLAYAVLGLFGLLAPAGLPALLTREGARRPQELGRLLSGGLTLCGGVSAVLTAAMLAVAALYEPATRASLAILSLALLPTACAACLEAACLALERTIPIGVACAAEHLLKVGLGLVLVASGFGVSAVLAAAVLGKALAGIVLILWLGRLGVRATPGVELRSLAAQTPVFALSALCASLYWRVDVLLLSGLRGVAEVGCYAAAYRVLDAAILLPQSLCLAVYPRLSAGRADPGAGRWLFGATMPLAVLATLGAGPLVGLLYGPRLADAAPVLSILIWTTVPYAWSRYQACRLVAAGRQITDLSINLALLAVNVALNLALIPRYGACGAAAATLTSALLYGAVQFACLRPRAAAI